MLFRSEEGFQYELIDGKLYVSPQPNAPQGLVELWLLMKLQQYWLKHPEVLSLVYNKTRVAVPGLPGRLAALGQASGPPGRRLLASRRR